MKIRFDDSEDLWEVLSITPTGEVGIWKVVFMWGDKEDIVIDMGHVVEITE